MGTSEAVRILSDGARHYSLEDILPTMETNRRLTKMTQPARLLFVGLILMSPAVALAGPAEEANMVVGRFSAAFSSNDPEAVVKLYTPDAILLGTVSPVISVGTEAIHRNT